MPHFFASDLLGLGVGLLLGIPIVLLPGFGFGWWFDLLHFRTTPIVERWPLAATLGIVTVPILLYLPFKFLSIHWVWAEILVLTLSGVFAIVSMPSPRWRLSRGFSIAAAVWLILAIFLLLDFHVGSRLYPSSAIIDSSVRAQVVASISRTHALPPDSIFSGSGPLRYHYLLFLLPALIEKLGAGLVSARMALAAITIWSGIALITTVAIFVRWAVPDSESRATHIAWALLLVGGFDCIPFVAEIIRRTVQNISPVLPLPDIEWSNGRGQVFSWLDTAIWHPHHIVALCACLLGGLLIFESRGLGMPARGIWLLFAAFAIATGLSVSVLVGSVFIAYLAIIAVELLLHSPRNAVALLACGVIVALLSTPVVQEWKAPAGQAESVSFSIGVRPFEPVTSSLTSLHVTSPLVWHLSYLLFLPLNYLLELGVFFVGAAWWANNRIKNGYNNVLREHLLIGLCGISLALVTFVQAGTVAANDFGYRAILPAQFVALLWTTELVTRLRQQRQPGTNGNSRRVMQIVVASTALGLVTTTIGVFVMRHSIGFSNPGVGMYHVALRQQHSAERLFDLRSAYLWIRRHTPDDAKVQEDPFSWQPLAAQYGERGTRIYSWFQGSDILGTNKADTSEFDRILVLFQPGTTSVVRNEICANTHIDYLVIQDSDPIWYDRSTYAWTSQPVFAANRVRVFRCGP